jgi:two-component sensor histidine kinase
VERQIRLITRLERSEQDSERLASLFQVDHLATRMRRNSENLLVLAGQELSRRYGQPVSLVDVLRAAVSEIEQYERVMLNVQPGISIRREAVRDVVHLIAELVENATSYSAAETPVTIEAHELSSSGALVEIADQGVGMRTEAMAHANWRLDNPPMVDVEVSRRMGLFVVAQLAARHGIRVRLRPAQSGGLSALVWLPDEAITDEKSRSGPLRSASASGDRATGHVTPMREAGQDAGIAPAPRPAPLQEHLATADSGRYQLADESAGNSAGNGESLAVTRPLPAMRGRLRAAEAGAAEAGAGAGQAETPPGEVLVPVADNTADHDRLPIFEAVESDWFRGGRQVVATVGQTSEAWSSPADHGFRAAEAVSAPTSAGTTRSGLPKRAPGTNLVPGTAASEASESASGTASKTQLRPKPPRSATDNRNRFASYQRGLQQGRAAAVSRDPNSGAGTTS